MKQFVYDAWNGVMNAKLNPLRNIPDMTVRHMALQALAWMWCAAFSLMIGDFMIFGTSIIAHAALIAAIVVTVATFETAKRRPHSFDFIKGYHAMGRSRSHVWSEGPDGRIKKIELPKGDPGGEHE